MYKQELSRSWKEFMRYKKRRSKLDHQLAIYVGVLAVIVLVGFSIFVQIPSVGQTALQNTPLVIPLDLDFIGESLIDIVVNPAFQVKMTTSSKENFVFNLVVEDFADDSIGDPSADSSSSVSSSSASPSSSASSSSGLSSTIQYTLYLNRVIIAKGLLDTRVSSSGGIHLDQDFKPDLELAYDGTYVLVKNLNFIAPAVARFALLDSNFMIKSENVFNVPIGVEQVFYFNVSTTSLPQVNGAFADLDQYSSLPPPSTSVNGTNGTNATVIQSPANYQLTEYKTGENYKTMKLVWTPREEKTYTFTLGAVVGGQVSSKTYLFAGNGVVYELQDDDYPTIKMVLNPNLKMVNVSYSFPRSNELQPFSLPCMGLVELRELTSRGNVAKVYGYTDKINQWQAGATSDLSRLRSGKGYVLKLADAQQPLSFTTSCSLENVELPSLAVGWNFIGVPGYRTYLLSELTLPPGRGITDSYELQRNGEHSSITSLEPGKAYWIKVE